eukprot:1188442-Prorocentrum_minimum.AAC.2
MCPVFRFPTNGPCFLPTLRVDIGMLRSPAAGPRPELCFSTQKPRRSRTHTLSNALAAASSSFSSSLSSSLGAERVRNRLPDDPPAAPPPDSLLLPSSESYGAELVRNRLPDVCPPDGRPAGPPPAPLRASSLQART